MAEVIQVKVSAETREAEEKLKRAQELADALGSKKTTIKIDSKSIDGADKSIRVFQSDVAKLKMDSGVFNAYINGAIDLQTALKGVQGETKKTSSVFDSLTKRFTAANLVSSLVTTGVNLLKQSLRQAVDEMKEMDKELTTIKMVTGASASDIAKLREQAFQGARETGRTTSDYLSAAERFARAGYRENIQDLTKLSLVTQNVGGVTEDVASKFLLAADAAWQMGGSAERLWAMLDGVTSIADQNATDIGKIAEAYTVAGSAFANAGESERTFAALIGTTTAATQRSGSEMARGLQTILFRVRQVKQELDDGEIINAEDISNAAKALDSVGISVMNDANELKSFSEIMGELNKKWDTLNSKQKAYLQNALAGNRRGNVLFSLMDNWDVFQKQLEQFDEASGTALEKNETYLESWDAATKQLKTSWTQFVSIMTGSGEPIVGAIKLITDAIDDLTKKFGPIAQFVKYIGDTLGKSEFLSWLISATGKSLVTKIFGADVYGLLEGLSELLNTALPEGYKTLTGAEKEAADAQNALVEGTISVLKVYKDESDAVDELSSAFNRASANIKKAAEGIKTDKDDAVKSAADIFKAMQEAAEKGYYGSNKYQTGIQLFFGTKDKSKIKNSAKEALSTYFKEIEEGDYSKAAANLWAKLSGQDGSIRDKNGNLIASMKDLGDSFKWTFDEGNKGIDNFLQSMQESTGISADFWASFIQSLGMYSDELDKWMEDHKESPEPDITLTVDNEEAKSKLDEINGMLKELPEEQQIKIKMFIDGMNIEEAYNYVKNLVGASKDSELNVVDDTSEEYRRKKEAAEKALIEAKFARAEATNAKEAGSDAEEAEAEAKAAQELATAWRKVAEAKEDSQKNGGPNAFDDQYDAVLREARTYAYSVTKDAEEAEEIVKKIVDAWAEATNAKEAGSDAEEAEAEAKAAKALADSWKDVAAAKEEASDESKVSEQAETDQAAAEAARLQALRQDLYGTIGDVGGLADAWAEVPEEVTTEAETETSEAESSIKTLLAWLKKIPEKVVSTIVVKYNKNGGTTSSGDTGSSGSDDGFSGGGGGHQFAKGKKDNYSGIALVNDEFPADGSKPELIISKSLGRAYIANGGRPALVNLRSDDIVLTAKETKDAVGFPKFDTGKKMNLPPTPHEDGGGNKSPSVTTPNPDGQNSDTVQDGDEGKKKKPNKDKQAQKDWEQLKKLVDYLLDKGERELKNQLKVLDKQLEELEAERKQRQEQNQLEEKQLAVQQALVDLEKAQNERTVRYYNEETQQWEWMADQGDIDKAQEALDNAQQNLNDYEEELEYNSKRDAINQQKQELQDQFDELTQSWADIVDAIEAPAGDLQALLKSMFGASGTLGAQAGSVADLLNIFREGIFGSGYSEGLNRINANTKKSTTTLQTVFGKKKGSIEYNEETSKGILMNAAIGPEFSKDSISFGRADIFADIGDSLHKLVDGSGESPVSKGISNIVNNNGGNFYLNGIQVGQDMYNKPFVEVLRTLSIHANEGR